MVFLERKMNLFIFKFLTYEMDSRKKMFISNWNPWCRNIALNDVKVHVDLPSNKLLRL